MRCVRACLRACVRARARVYMLGVPGECVRARVRRVYVCVRARPRARAPACVRARARASVYMLGVPGGQAGRE